VELLFHYPYAFTAWGSINKYTSSLGINTPKTDDHPVECQQLKILRDLSKKSNEKSREGVGI